MNWHIAFSWILPTWYNQVKLTLKRLDVTDYGVFGHLTMDSCDWNCVTLERHDIDIPVGIYKVTLYNSPSHGCLVPLLHDVPGRTFVEIHWGNWEHDSKGCILVGQKRDQDMILYSKDTFEQLMTHLQNMNDIQITIV